MSAIDALTQSSSMYSASTLASKQNTSSSASTTTATPTETFIGKAGAAVSAGDVGALVTALAQAKAGEASVYGASGVLQQAGTQTGWSILMGNSDDSSSNADGSDNSVFSTLTPDIVKARTSTASTSASSLGNFVKTSA